eukprot:GILJ01008942.1.p1 GENE.GILJ01008942.1~~GILJ01008942.1.p1  ORF type:complete len:131 (-),score=12.92 GILJ01008942.1:129-521(-)
MLCEGAKLRQGRSPLYRLARKPAETQNQHKGRNSVRPFVSTFLVFLICVCRAEGKIMKVIKIDNVSRMEVSRSKVDKHEIEAHNFTFEDVDWDEVEDEGDEALSDETIAVVDPDWLRRGSIAWNSVSSAP